MPTNVFPRALSVDCEMVGCGDKGQISVLGRIAVVNDKLELLMDTFVRPSYRVTNFRTKWSGLTWNDLKDGECFETVRQRFLHIVEHYREHSEYGLVIVGHDVSNDLQVLDWKPSDTEIRDTAMYYPLRRMLVNSLLDRGLINKSQTDGYIRQKVSLKTFSKYLLNRNIQEGSHCPVEDATCTMLLYLKARDKWENIIKNRRSLCNTSLNSVLMSDEDLGSAVNNSDLKNINDNSHNNNRNRSTNNNRFRKRRKKSKGMIKSH
ncbi:exonuclease family protein [Cryptosporidium muris RN66]|uniref:Exonuclease family protein n=1 Tax=Cryptosporidium muris (strain RN66) TaxID=441375 RepID=B6AFC4_CRYMR|nr:exonuclease family protein [Cryptosporidium muris RN66]EEA06915.1 exonuclease family protein [Cryptosporidium muris RN66]|eukprot:XP_002141264.1 exonuclease family protein [Cryptosporidium muris RN66]